MNMNQMILQGKWRQARGIARENWGRLTNNDSQRYSGKADRFLGSIEERFGHTRMRAEHDLKDFLTQYPIPGMARITPKPSRPDNILMRRPWLMLMVVSALIMLVRVLAQKDETQKSHHHESHKA